MPLMLALVIVLNVIVAVLGQRGHDSETGVSCPHCSGPHHKHFPDCLTDQHKCHEHEYCYISNKHEKDIHVECWTKEDCKEVHQCSFEDHSTCEMCCLNDTCVQQQLSLLKALSSGHPVSTIQATPTTQTGTTSGLYKVASRLLTEVCDDLILLDGCKTSAPTVCKDITGVSMCPETCGLCTLLKDTFRGNTTCQDELSHSQCPNTPAFCNGPLAELTCPKTCNLCESILVALIQMVVDQQTSTQPSATDKTIVVTQAPLKSSTSFVSTQAPVMGSTLEVATMPFSTDAILPSSQATVAMSTDGVLTDTSTQDACFDDLSDCDSVDGICQNDLAPMICRKFCNFCDQSSAKTIPASKEDTTQGAFVVG